MTTWAVCMVNPSRAAGTFSECGRYRYRLDRVVGWDGPEQNDATVRKLIGFGARGGASELIGVNKFAYIATDVKELRRAGDPIGPDNDKYIEQAFRDADMHFVAWGPLGKLPKHLRGRYRDIIEIARRVGCKLHCFGTAQDGHPRHPLMVPYYTPIIEWTGR